MQVQLSDLEYAYKREKDARVKERILLIMLIKEGRKPAHAARELRRAKSWAYTWRDRYEAEGIEGLRDKPRSGRPPMISQRVQMSIRKHLRSYPYGWKTREVMRLIYRRAGVVYSETHVCRLLHKWGFRRKVPIK
ncbi:MAG: helix-turn-helix domain-containing protein, partial [Nitrososphaerales archaeon]